MSDAILRRRRIAALNEKVGELTPRTDLMWERANADAGPHYAAADSMRDFARQLEREIYRLQKQVCQWPACEADGEQCPNNCNRQDGILIP